jgi:2-amino-4-hydroxy-6-hydroxymethyldihydropteridine diphosphokinase|tara:strand:- start:497 stop:979 length:483 start_codon:yes stop_codon:yes gene_type:complete
MRVFIGIGSNIADPESQIHSAQQALMTLPMTQFVVCSSMYKSPPMGPQDQPDYINAVTELETLLTPHDILDCLQRIEEQQGRVRGRHWGERTIDLDLLLYGDELIADARLKVPHIGIAQRAFVLYPLAEIDADIMIPGIGLITSLLAECPRDGLERLISK